MIWTRTSLDGVANDLAAVGLQSSNDPPSIHELHPFPAELTQSAIRRVGVERWEHRLHAESGALDLLVRTPEDGAEAMDAALALALEIDPGRRWSRWSDLDDEERPRLPLVDELVAHIDGIPAIGPGGRIRLMVRTDGMLVEASVRPRAGGAIPGRWRPPEEVAESVREAAGETRGARIRFAFGYHEASSYERQRWLRPAFVFLVDQPEPEPARWRVVIVEPATESEDLPPDAGLEGARGGCP